MPFETIVIRLTAIFNKQHHHSTSTHNYGPFRNDLLFHAQRQSLQGSFRFPLYSQRRHFLPLPVVDMHWFHVLTLYVDPCRCKTQ